MILSRISSAAEHPPCKRQVVCSNQTSGTIFLVDMSKNFKKNITVVEDDEILSSKIVEMLRDHEYTANVIDNGAEAVEIISKTSPDLILLDWMLPGKSGLEICKEIRASTLIAQVPIIMISSRDKDFEKVLGLEMGIDDYITKPFSAPELVARIQALLRRVSYEEVSSDLGYKDISLRPEERVAKKGARELRLSPIEFQILHVLMQTPEVAVKREVLVKKIWGLDKDVEMRTIDVHMTRLRKELSDGGADYIETVRSFGYKLMES